MDNFNKDEQPWSFSIFKDAPIDEQSLTQAFQKSFEKD